MFQTNNQKTIEKLKKTNNLKVECLQREFSCYSTKILSVDRKVWFIKNNNVSFYKSAAVNPRQMLAVFFNEMRLPECEC